MSYRKGYTNARNIIILDEDGKVVVPFSMRAPGRSTLFTHAGRCTFGLVFKDLATHVPVDGGAAVAVQLHGERFFAFTARHVFDLRRKDLEIAASFGLENMTSDFVVPEPLDILNSSNVVAVAPTFDVVMFEMHPADAGARERLARRAAHLNRLIIPRPEAIPNADVPVAICGYPKALASLSMDVFPGLVQLHYVATIANDALRSIALGDEEHADRFLVVEADTTNATPDGQAELPALQGCSGSGYFVGALRADETKAYYTGVAGIHTKTVEVTYKNGQTKPLLLGPTAEVLVTMLHTAVPELRPEIERIWSGFVPAPIDVVPDEPR
jgi:hypothetical protein